MKRVLDVELALHWAYREELLRQREQPTAWASLASVHELGIRVAAWPVDASWIGEVHPDAKAIAEAVDGLAAIQAADYDEDPGIGLAGFQIDPRPILAKAVGQVRQTVVAHASMASRPPIGEPPKPSPRRQSRGQVAVVRDVTAWQPTVAGGQVAMPCEVPAPQNGGRYRSGAYCPLIWEPSPRAILLDRADYIAWWAALDWLAAELAGCLETLVVTPPAAAQRPWAGEKDQAGSPKLLTDVRNPLTQRAKLALMPAAQVQRQPRLPPAGAFS